MELKRYVLDTQRCFIYDLTKEADVKKFEMISKFATHFMNGSCKTSDNILDLVVPCTLWDLDGDLYEHTAGDFVMIDKVFNDSSMNTRNVTAIFKRQPNGDYRRYDVMIG